MTFSWPFGRRDDPGWRDAADDPIPARLRGIALEDAEVARRVTRRRGAVLGEFAARQGAPRASAPWRPRRLAFAMVTATLMLAVTAGGIAASGPGLPAYPIRLAVEELLLPAGPAARLDGQLGRLERRLAEAAASASNPDAVAAALEAYERIAAEISTMAPPAGSDEVRVQTRLTEQLRSLQRIGGENGRGVRAATRSANGLLLWLGVSDGEVPLPDASGAPTEPSASAHGSAAPSPSGSPQPAAPSPDPRGSPAGNGGAGGQGPDDPPRGGR